MDYGHENENVKAQLKRENGVDEVMILVGKEIRSSSFP
jgi:hypothetical protein